MRSPIDLHAPSATQKPHFSGRGAAVRIWRPLPMIGALLAVLATLGCAVGTPSADNDFRYDLGPAQAQATLTQGDPQPAVRVFDVRAPRALDSNAIIYRLNYVDPRRAAAYAHSHWTMPPALLLTQRLRAALSAQGTVAAPGAAVLGPLLTVDLDEFEQVFDAEGQSHGALTARATLTRNGQVMAQRTFVARAPSEMPNAAGGVGALAVASDDFIAQLIAWLDIQASVAAR